MTRKSNNDLIAQALNITPMVGVAAENSPIVIDDRDPAIMMFGQDLETARTNILKLIETGTSAVELLKMIAESTEAARAFEVLSTLINTMLAANKDLIELHKTARDMTNEGSPDGPDTVNNNLFVGTTEEALAMIRAKRNGNENK